jgi:hypothetical protein
VGTLVARKAGARRALTDGFWPGGVLQSLHVIRLVKHATGPEPPAVPEAGPETAE